MKEEAAAGVPPHWNVYIAVDDVDQLAPKASQNGGKIVMGPFDVFDAGRMAFVQDPSGAVLGLWQAKKHIGAQINMEPNTLCWAELMTNNVDAAGKYYVNLLGWKSDHMPQMNYTMFKVGEQNVVGMTPLPPPMAKAPSHWMIYFAVESCDETVKKVGSLGGKVLVPGTDIPKMGRFAIFQDPQGAAFAVFQPAPR
jgi:predicted enzyme related to lactoylglutathione lyase